MKKGLFEDAESLAITDNAKMEELVIPEGCFPKMQYLSIQGRFLVNKHYSYHSLYCISYDFHLKIFLICPLWISRQV